MAGYPVKKKGLTPYKVSPRIVVEVPLFFIFRLFFVVFFYFIFYAMHY